MYISVLSVSTDLWITIGLLKKYNVDEKYTLNVVNVCGKAKIYEIQKLFHIATIPTRPV